ncbi:MAG: hypothetical protein JW912_04675, partial [Sedimentisphaerales bacterium]|nr:hypothetical protein [Sedimentisphaerales bacterium]
MNVDEAKPEYLNSALPIKKRVEDLLSQMTLEEKVAQMLCVWNDAADTLIDEKGDFDLKKAKESFKEGNGLGHVGRPGTA